MEQLELPSKWRLLWLGAFFALFFIAFFFSIQSISSLIYLEWFPFEQTAHTDDSYLDGNLVLVASSASAFLSSVLLYAFIAFHWIDSKPTFFTLKQLPGKVLIIWLLILLFFCWIIGLLGEWMGRPEVHPFVSSMFESTSHPLWLAMSLVILVPFFEESLFRGMLLDVWRTSVLGQGGAMIVTSFIWSVIHFQYGWFEWLVIFILGITLCIARMATRSIWTPILLHSLFNGLACYQAWINIS